MTTQCQSARPEYTGWNAFYEQIKCLIWIQFHSIDNSSFERILNYIYNITLFTDNKFEITWKEYNWTNAMSYKKIFWYTEIRIVPK